VDKRPRKSGEERFRYDYGELDGYFDDKGQGQGQERKGSAGEEGDEEEREGSGLVREMRAVSQATEAVLHKLETASAQLSRTGHPVLAKELCELISASVAALKQLKSLNKN